MKESTISSAETSISTPWRRIFDHRGQVFLQLQRGLVLHVDLDGHQQVLAHPQDWNPFHVDLSRFGRLRDTVWPVMRMAGQRVGQRTW
jgi:hypothetical protein